METLTMSKRSRKHFTIRLVVAIGVALGGISAIGSVIAYSAVERAWMIAQETATKALRPPDQAIRANFARLESGGFPTF
jgi:NAD/NADP transhydrogenase beta subunit